MADLFSVTAPLLIRDPAGRKRVMAEVFRHPEGLLYFDLFWHRQPPDEGIHLVKGAVHGDGPWKVGDCVVTLLGCQGTNPEAAAEYADWQFYLESQGADYPAPAQIEVLAREYGAL